MWEISKAVWPPGLKWRAWEVCDKPPISLHLPTENTHGEGSHAASNEAAWLPN